MFGILLHRRQNQMNHVIKATWNIARLSLKKFFKKEHIFRASTWETEAVVFEASLVDVLSSRSVKASETSS